MTGEAIVLVGHGARDPAWAAPLERLARALERAGTGASVRLAFLEFLEPELSSALDALCADGKHTIRVVPVFLGAGGHVVRDLAARVVDAQMRNPGVRFELEPPVGERSAVIDSIAGAIAGGA